MRSWKTAVAAIVAAMVVSMCVGELSPSMTMELSTDEEQSLADFSSALTFEEREAAEQFWRSLGSYPSNPHHKSITKPSNPHHKSITKPSNPHHKSITKPSNTHHKSITKPSNPHHKSITNPSNPHHKSNKKAPPATKATHKKRKHTTKPSNSITKPSNSITKPSNSITKPSNSITKPSTSITNPSTSITNPSNSITNPSNSITKPTATPVISTTHKRNKKGKKHHKHKGVKTSKQKTSNTGHKKHTNGNAAANGSKGSKTRLTTNGVRIHKGSKRTKHAKAATTTMGGTTAKKHARHKKKAGKTVTQGVKRDGSSVGGTNVTLSKISTFMDNSGYNDTNDRLLFEDMDELLSTNSEEVEEPFDENTMSLLGESLKGGIRRRRVQAKSSLSASSSSD